MNQEQNELDRIEATLRNLPLRSPSRVLDERVAATLAARQRRGRGWVWSIAGSIAAAAVVLIAVLPKAPDSPLPDGTHVVRLPTTASDPADPVQLVQTSTTWSDEGIVAAAEEGPIRQYRVELVKQIWQETQDGLAVFTIPEEQVVYVQAQAY